ncbi:hypothetical protein DL769_003938 [Monosporascus sp. CRB-8-3]|nr:hypothetical protein DL769_003938 [Monosporascus sp. CRB-8-3]
MRVGSLFAALSAAAVSNAMTFRVMSAEEQKMDYVWEVTGWSAGCARSGCYYDFNITAEANTTSFPQRPAFSAYCHGFGEGAPYELCDLLMEPKVPLAVEAKLLPADRAPNATTKANIQVSVQHIDLQTPTTYWNYTAKGQATYNQFVAPLMNFTMRPHEMFGAA